MSGYGSIIFIRGGNHRPPIGPGVPFTICECGASMRIYVTGAQEDPTARTLLCDQGHPFGSALISDEALEQMEAAAVRAGEL